MSAPKKILVVDDEPDITDIVSYNLRKEGFDVSISSDGADALETIRRNKFDLLILDLMLPEISGIDLCKILRADPQTSSLPIIMLTAKTEEIDKVLGLESGADDYITKPFSIRELIARVRALLRRTKEIPQKERVIRFGDLLIDRDSYRVTKKGDLIELSAIEFKILLYLVERKGRVFGREQLLDAVWSGEAYVEPRTVDVHIRRLRTQIEDDPANPSYIKTKRGIGYYANPDI